MAEFLLRPDILVLWTAVAAVTYMTRIGGHLVLSRFARIPPRLEAALEAVPAAVLTAIVLPPAIQGGVAEVVTILVAGVAALRMSPLVVLLAGLVALVAMRGVGL